MANVAYFSAASSEHGIAYSRDAFRQMSRLRATTRREIKQALSHMRTDDTHDELLTEALRVRRLASGARFVFERAGSALTVLSITDTQNSRT
tara:strand:+ start:238 stop:513 length:276 start_codon:yes stop_codon:yes gene_type:complete